MDIQLAGDFSAQWNFNNTSTWAIDPILSIRSVAFIPAKDSNLTMSESSLARISVMIRSKTKSSLTTISEAKTISPSMDLGQMEDKSIADRLSVIPIKFCSPVDKKDATFIVKIKL
jgi:hypothetical protein